MAIEGRWTYRLLSISFGLTTSHREYIWEEVFICVYYGHLSFVDAYNMPIHRRKWWIRKINEVVEKQNQQQNEVVQTPQSRSSGGQSLRARNIGR